MAPKLLVLWISAAKLLGLMCSGVASGMGIGIVVDSDP